LVINQQINIGQFIAAEIIILLVINSVEKIILNIENLYDVLTALDKLGQVTDIKLESEGGKHVCEDNDRPMEVEIKNLTFQFESNSKNVFSNLNLHINPGQHTAILGDDGSGKTTLLHLIGNLFPVNEGSISFNKIPSIDLNLENLRSSIGDYVSEQHLFYGSIEENITLKRENIKMRDLIWACEQVHLTDDIHSLKNGFSTQIDPNGKSFSRSFAQKIILARCIINKPKLLLMDDQQRFTSSTLKDVNYLSELLFNEDASWTLIAATKNENWLKHFKQIIKIEEGQIIFKGSYSDYLNYSKK